MARTTTSSNRAKNTQRQQAASARARLAVELERRRRRRRRLGLVLIPVAVVVLAVIVLVGVRFLGRSGEQAGPTGSVDPTVISQVSAVPGSVLNQVGAGTNTVAPSPLTGDLLTADGKPKVLYVGAEFCPFCAADRWPLAVALSRFGTLSGVGQLTSSEDHLATLSFQGATLTSSTIAFAGYEIEDQQGRPLETPPASDAAVYSQLGRGSFPFVDIGGKYLINSGSYDVDVLRGKSQQDIAAALSDPNSDVAQAVNGTANVITAAICATTGSKPADVCSSAGVQAGAAKLG